MKLELKEKAKTIFELFEQDCYWIENNGKPCVISQKSCAIISVENEYKSLRELLFNLKSCHVLENEKVYLKRIQNLIDDEKLLIDEINSF